MISQAHYRVAEALPRRVALSIPSQTVNVTRPEA